MNTAERTTEIEGRRPRRPQAFERRLELSLPDFRFSSPVAGLRRQKRYEAEATVHKRRAPYVAAAVGLEHIPHAAGRETVYALDGRVVSAFARKSDGRAMPPLGSTQRLEGGRALEMLKEAVRAALLHNGWRRLTADEGASKWGMELWQAPEGEYLDGIALKRSERIALHGRIAAAVDAVLDGDGMAGAEFRGVPMGKEWWRVWAEPHGGGLKIWIEPEPAPVSGGAPEHAEDLCECGDFRRQHEGGIGRCLLEHSHQPCGRFALFASKAESDAAAARLEAGETEGDR